MTLDARKLDRNCIVGDKHSQPHHPSQNTTFQLSSFSQHSYHQGYSCAALAPSTITTRHDPLSSASNNTVLYPRINNARTKEKGE